MIGQLEAMLEGPPGDAAMQVGDLLLLGIVDLAAHGQDVLLDHQLEVILAETRDSQGDLVVVLAGAHDVVRRVGGFLRVAERRLEQIVQAVEADRVTEQG